MKDSLWSIDLFRCESLTLRTHWILVVMDQFTRSIVGFGIHREIVDGVALCRMFKQAIQRRPLPKYLSTDHDPLYRFHQWEANLRVRMFFWTAADLEAKLLDFQEFYNGYQTHAGLEGLPPEPIVDGAASGIDFASYGWQKHCRGLYQTPIAA
jgi:transposase InsO family protein